MSFISGFIKSIKAEKIKVKGSGIYLITLILAGIIPVLYTVVNLFVNLDTVQLETKTTAWKDLTGNIFSAYSGFFYQLFLTLIVVRITQIEHKNGGWKLIETQPVHKHQLFFSKFLYAAFVSLLFIVAIIVLLVICGLILWAVKPQMGFGTSPFPFGYTARLAFRFWVAGLGILGIQYFFSILFEGFMLPFSIGLVATIVSSIAVQFNKALWVPYASPLLTTRNEDGGANGSFLLFNEWQSILWMLFSLCIGYILYNRKKLVPAFLKPFYRILFFLVPVAALILGIRLINKPVVVENHTRTVLKGKVVNKKDREPAPEFLYLITFLTYDTVATIPVTEGSFEYVFTDSLPASMYLFGSSTVRPVQIYFGTNDSVHAEITIDNRRQDYKISGTRVAENEYLKTARFEQSMGSYFLENNYHNMKPYEYYTLLVGEVEKAHEDLNKYKTPDNLKPKEDFIALQKQLKSLKYITLGELTFPRFYKMYHPKDSFKIIPAAQKFLDTTARFNDQLLPFDAYQGFVEEYISKKYRIKTQNDTAYFNTLNRQLPKGQLRDFLIYQRIKTNIEKIKDTVIRSMYVKEFTPLIANEAYKKKIQSQHKLLSGLGRGFPAFNVLSKTITNDTIAFSDFKGKYLVVDVWASWCGPCKVQYPAFEEAAEKFADKNAAFISVSIDDDAFRWQYDIVDKSDNVVQLLALKKEDLSKGYGIEAIPRFMLIDPNGRIVSAQLPYPTDRGFMEILQSEIK